MLHFLKNQKSITMKYIAVYILFVISASLILTNRLTAAYITDYRVHFALLAIATATFAITVGHLFGKLKSPKSIIVTCVIALLLCAAKAFFTWGGDWKTQEVLYQNIENPRVTIESQMRDDPLSVTYKNRVVEVQHIFPFIDVTHDVDTSAIDNAAWRRVDERLKNPGCAK